MRGTRRYSDFTGSDHETLHGALANLWFLLLSHPEEFEKARSEPRLMKLAYLETMRHSPPVLASDRFAKHEVERFGRLIPQELFAAPQPQTETQGHSLNPTGLSPTVPTCATENLAANTALMVLPLGLALA